MHTKFDLQHQLRAMGILPTDTVLIHTSMRAMGLVEGGADGVLDAFTDYLHKGLFLVPTHTWANVNAAQPVYDVRSTAPCIGTLPTVAAFRTQGVRSLHPTHSLWAVGQGAATFVAGEEHACTPCPSGGAWDRLSRVGAKILLIGVGNDKNTFIHAVEEEAAIPDRLQPTPFEVTVLDAQGRACRHPFAGHYCSRSADVSRQFVNFEKPLVALGAQTIGRLGDATVRVVDAARCREILLRIFSRADRDLCIAPFDIPTQWYR